MGKRGRELARERRQKRLEQLSELRKLPIPPHHRWWSPEMVAVVTGSSRGIGLEIARQLASNGLLVVIASRDADLCCRSAEKILEEHGLPNVEPFPRRLDVSDSDSVASFANWIGLRFGGIDILVNNAGVNFNFGPNNLVEFAETVMATNYFGMKRMIEVMIPMMKPSVHGARILNVGSRLGKINGRRNRLGDATLRDQFSRDDCLSEELIDNTVAKFLEQAREGTWASKGWPQMYTDYSVSKLAVNTYTRLMARVLSTRPEGQKIYINCYCPGWVKTAMTNWEGNMSVEEGADTGVWALLMLREPRLGDATLRDQFSRDDCLSEELIDNTVAKFLEQAREGTWASKGWPQMYTDYSVSKLAVNTYTRLMARVLSTRPEGQKIYINCYCPGWVKTAMTNWEGNMSVEEGADTGVWALLMLREPVTGKFFAERREINF